MVLVRERGWELGVGHRAQIGVAATADGTPVCGAVNVVGLMAKQFHDVNFPATRPAGLAKVGPKHPKGGPQSLAVGQHRTDVNAAKCELLLVFGDHPSRRVACPVLERNDEQVAVFHKRIGLFRRVLLTFVVAPSSGTQFMGPVVHVNLRSIEFIRPHEGHALRWAAWRMRRVVSSLWKGDHEVRVVIQNRACGFLLVAFEVPIDGVGQHDGERLIGLQCFVNDDGDADDLNELPRCKDQSP